MKNVGNGSSGHSQAVSKIFSAPMYMAHCAVIFAIAQVSCQITCWVANLRSKILRFLRELRSGDIEKLCTPQCRQSYQRRNPRRRTESLINTSGISH